MMNVCSWLMIVTHWLCAVTQLEALAAVVCLATQAMVLTAKVNKV